MREKLLNNKLSRAECYKLVQNVTKHFWNRWEVKVTPDWVVRQKYHKTGLNLKVGDLLLVHDKFPVKGKYVMTIVEAVSIGKDGLVRSCKVIYGVPRGTKDVHRYKGRRWVSISRSIQILNLLLATEEQTKPLTVEENTMKFTEESEAADVVKTLDEDKAVAEDGAAVEEAEEEAVKTLVEEEVVYLTRLKVSYFNFLKCFYVCSFSQFLSTLK